MLTTAPANKAMTASPSVKASAPATADRYGSVRAFLDLVQGIGIDQEAIRQAAQRAYDATRDPEARRLILAVSGSTYAILRAKKTGHSTAKLAQEQRERRTRLESLLSQPNPL